MKSSAAALVLTFTFIISACTPSLNPLYTEADLAVDSSLIGTWEDKESGETWTFSNSEKYKYTLVNTDSDGRKSVYDAWLVKLEGELFLDIFPFKPGVTRQVATHTFVYISRNDSTVEISYMEPRWLKDYLAANPDAISHEKINGEIVLTSSPKEMQKFVMAHLKTREAFSSPAELSRKRGGS